MLLVRHGRIDLKDIRVASFGVGFWAAPSFMKSEAAGVCDVEKTTTSIKSWGVNYIIPKYTEYK